MIEKLNPAQLNDEQGQILVRLARQTIAEKLGVGPEQVTGGDDEGVLNDGELQAHRGTFVTLKLDNQLRGCIGTLSATESIVDSIKNNAVNAAFHDYRFSPLAADELEQVMVEVSILTEPTLLDYKNGDDLLERLTPHVDGVIIRKGSASATFLPQVWEQLPQPEEFLAHLCRKAGLASNAWRNKKLEVSTYQVQYFEEEG